MTVTETREPQLSPVIPEAEPQARLSGTSCNEANLTRSRFEAVLAFGSHRFDRDDGWKAPLTLIAERASTACPGSFGSWDNGAPPVATGRGCIRPLTCRRPAPGRQGLNGGPRSRRPDCARFRQSASNVAEPETAERHMASRMGSDPQGLTPTKGRRCTAGQKSPLTRAPQGDPGDPRKVPGSSPRGSQGGFAKPPGAGGQPALGLPMGRPRTRRTFAGPLRRGGRRVRHSQQTQPNRGHVNAPARKTTVDDAMCTSQYRASARKTDRAPVRAQLEWARTLGQAAHDASDRPRKVEG